MKRSIATIAAAITLGGSLVACTNDEGTASDPDASAVNEGNGAANASPHEAEENVHASDASETASDDAEPSDADSESADGSDGDSDNVEETVEQETADGEVTLIPADFQEAIAQVESEWGLPETIEQNDNGAVATFAENNLLTWSEDTDAQPLVGMIGQTWVDDGGLDNPIGLPVEAESEADGAEGWTQQFQNGVINWVNNNGEWTAEIEEN